MLRSKLMLELVATVRKREEDAAKEYARLADRLRDGRTHAARLIQRMVRMHQNGGVLGMLRKEKNRAEKAELKQRRTAAATSIQKIIRGSLEKRFVRNAVSGIPEMATGLRRRAMRTAFLKRQVAHARSHAAGRISAANSIDRKIGRAIARNEPVFLEMAVALRKEREGHCGEREKVVKALEELRQKERKVRERPKNAQMLLSYLRKMINHLMEERMVRDRAIDSIDVDTKRIDEDLIWRTLRGVSRPVYKKLVQEDIEALEKEVMDRQLAMDVIAGRIDELATKVRSFVRPFVRFSFFFRFFSLLSLLCRAPHLLLLLPLPSFRSSSSLPQLPPFAN